jgi:hypothetical protein
VPTVSKVQVTVFLCAGKHCARAWDRVCDGRPAKWLKRQVADAGLPYHLDVIKTACMDRCKDAANLCAVHGDAAVPFAGLCHPDDAERFLAHLRSSVERHAAAPADRGA